MVCLAPLGHALSKLSLWLSDSGHIGGLEGSCHVHTLPEFKTATGSPLDRHHKLKSGQLGACMQTHSYDGAFARQY